MQVISPHTTDDWREYFEVRWQVLRAPWDQPRGSERDVLDEQASHCLVRNHLGQAVAVGRVYLNTAGDAQIRFMAVLPAYQRQGVGRKLLNELQQRAVAAGAQRLLLNARDTAVGFYEKHGFVSVGAAPTLFGVIPHTQMEKKLSQPADDKLL